MRSSHRDKPRIQAHVTSWVGLFPVTTRLFTKHMLELKHMDQPSVEGCLSHEQTRGPGGPSVVRGSTRKAHGESAQKQQLLTWPQHLGVTRGSAPHPGATGASALHLAVTGASAPHPGAMGGLSTAPGSHGGLSIAPGGHRGLSTAPRDHGGQCGLSTQEPQEPQEPRGPRGP